jgi:hypothetical protein
MRVDRVEDALVLALATREGRAEGKGDGGTHTSTTTTRSSEGTCAGDKCAAVDSLPSRFPFFSKISFVTDIEGDMAFLERFVNTSEVVQWDEDGIRGTAGGDTAKAAGVAGAAATASPFASPPTSPPPPRTAAFRRPFRRPARRLDLVDPTRHGFVFGGDLFDKGPHDARLSDLLVDFKTRYPDRVFLLAGNRDLNKLRLSAELSDGEMNRDPATGGVEPDLNVTAFGGNKPTLAEHLAQEALPDSVANRLRYYYEHTLGCPSTFEFTRQEIAEIAAMDGRPVAAVSDEEVAAWVRASVFMASSMQEDEENMKQAVLRSAEETKEREVGEHESGGGGESGGESGGGGLPMRLPFPFSDGDGHVVRYLKVCDMCVRIGNTVFVHGALKETSLGFVPRAGEDGVGRLYHQSSLPQSANDVPGKRLDMEALGAGGVEAWIQGLDRFKREELEDYWRRPDWDAARRSRGGAGLVAWQSSPASFKLTPVVESHLSRGEALPVSTAVQATLNRCGVFRVCCGHKPAEDCPVVLRQSGLETVHADMCYSDKSAPDKRGIAVTEVLVVEGAEGGGSSRLHGQKMNHTVIHGVLRDGQKYMYALPGRPCRGGGASGASGVHDAIRHRVGADPDADAAESGVPYLSVRAAAGNRGYEPTHHTIARGVSGVSGGCSGGGNVSGSGGGGDGDGRSLPSEGEDVLGNEQKVRGGGAEGADGRCSSGTVLGDAASTPVVSVGGGDPFVGLRWGAENFLVKARLSDGRYFLARTENRQETTLFLSADEMAAGAALLRSASSSVTRT